ncbi:MAG: hypothetical protein K6E91_14745 [Butyrivibrio sp.]|nr:hypothetical protein [Butyrivibrio sp.]
MGPDIYVPDYDTHQNPMRSTPPSLWQAETTIIKNTILAVILPLYYKKVIRRHEEGRR